MRDTIEKKPVYRLVGETEEQRVAKDTIAADLFIKRRKEEEDQQHHQQQQQQQ
jgi:hypothetical protein